MAIKYSFDDTGDPRVHLSFEGAGDGDVAIRARRGSTSATIGYLTNDGRLLRASIFGEELKELGFETDDNGQIVVK